MFDTIIPITETIQGYIGDIFMGIIIVVALFAGYVAYKLITSNDDGKRKQAKQQLICTLVAIIAIYALQGLIGFVLDKLLSYA